MAQVQVEVPYINNHEFGVGVDLATGSPMGKVVEGEVSGVTAAGGATTEFRIAQINSTSELESALGIDVEASGGCGLFSASARMSYAKNSKVQTSSLFMAITAKVTLENLTIDDPTLTASALNIAGRNDAFAERFGNMFVRGITRGGLFVGVVQIDTSNSEDSMSLSAELSGSYGLFSAELETSFKEVQKKYKSEIRISVYHEGGPIDLTMDNIADPTQLYVMMQAWLKSFQDDPAKNAKPYSVTLAPIAIANGPIPPNSADIQHAQDVLMTCAKQRSQILDGLNLMDFMVQKADRYDFAGSVTLPDVVQAAKGYQSDLSVVAGAASHTINHVHDALTPVDFAAKAGKPYPLGIPPTPLPTLKKGLTDAMAAKGEILTRDDPLAAALGEREPVGPARRGFFIGMAVAEGDTLVGPGKDRFGADLLPEEQQGFQTAVRFTVDRNRNAQGAAVGAAIAISDPAVAAARQNASPFFTLGFDIASGIFGDPARGAIGNTATGPGSLGIRNLLTQEAQHGFNAAVAFYLGPPLRNRL